VVRERYRFVLIPGHEDPAQVPRISPDNLRHLTRRYRRPGGGGCTGTGFDATRRETTRMPSGPMRSSPSRSAAVGRGRNEGATPRCGVGGESPSQSSCSPLAGLGAGADGSCRRPSPRSTHLSTYTATSEDEESLQTEVSGPVRTPPLAIAGLARHIESVERLTTEQLEVNVSGLEYFGRPCRLGPALGCNAGASHSSQQHDQPAIDAREEGERRIVECREVPLERPAARRLEVEKPQSRAVRKRVVEPDDPESTRTTPASASSCRWEAVWGLGREGGTDALAHCRFCCASLRCPFRRWLWLRASPLSRLAAARPRSSRSRAS
jgi:hypothetical protein